MKSKHLDRLNELSGTILKWANLNFTLHRPKLGIMEEVGEFAKAILKRGQGIREFANFEYFVNEAKDALGDIAIYTLHDMAMQDYKLTDVDNPKYELSIPATDEEYDLIEEALGELAETAAHNLQGLESYMGDPMHESIFSQLDGFAVMFKSDIYTITLDTWTEVVSKRDWKKNPKDGGSK